MILAYLDPGSGSLILQAVLGGAAGIGVAAKAMRHRWQTRNMAADEEASADDTEATEDGDPAEHAEAVADHTERSEH